MKNYKDMVKRLVAHGMEVNRAIQTVAVAYALTACQRDDLQFQVKGV